MKTVLITGGAGFIGSNFTQYLLAKFKDIVVVNLDLLTYAGDPSNLADVSASPGYKFVKGDICDRLLLDELFQTYLFDGVFHFAAESHVDNSISGPEAFIRTNVFGTFCLLETARRSWMNGPSDYKLGMEMNRFLHVSTDEVYGSLPPTGYFTESTPYAPNSPYSASKAGSDMLARSYYHTYGFNVVTTNCSNNYGPRQHKEKLIPTIIRNALAGKPIPIYGDGKNVRDWLYVADHCSGVLTAFMKGTAGQTYNIGGGNEQMNIDIVRTICRLLDAEHPRKDGKSYAELMTFVKDRAGHDRRYAIDSSKIQSELGWRPTESFEEGIRKTVKWYISKFGLTSS